MSTDPKDTLEMPDMAGRQRILQEYQHSAVVGFSSQATSQHFFRLVAQPVGGWIF